MVNAHARAHRWQRMLESGECGTLARLSAAERISRSHIGRAVRVTLLARTSSSMSWDGARGLLEAFPMDWEIEHELLCRRLEPLPPRPTVIRIPGKPSGFIRLPRRLLLIGDVDRPSSS
jgi:hypothetical protein